jgi:hypothetical protein
MSSHQLKERPCIPWQHFARQNQQTVVCAKQRGHLPRGQHQIETVLDRVIEVGGESKGFGLHRAAGRLGTRMPQWRKAPQVLRS